MAELELLTNSARNAFGECHRKYKFKYVDGVKLVNENENLRFGTLVHKCLELWWMYHTGTYMEIDGVVTHMTRAQMASRYLDERQAAGDDLFELSKARVMMEGYESKWGAVECQTVAVEQQFVAPLVNPDTNGVSRTWQLAGKMDAIAYIDGLLQVIEHKTAGGDISPESKYWTKLAIDGQVSQYYVGGRVLGHDIQGTVYDVLKKPAQRPSKIPLLDEAGKKIVNDAEGNRVYNKDGKTPKQSPDAELGYELQTRPETPEEYEARVRAEVMGDLDKYFRRLPVPRLDSDLVEWMGDMWSIGREIAEAKNANRFPKNPRSCDNYGTCEFFEVCAGRESIDNPHIFKRGEINAELLTETVEAF